MTTRDRRTLLDLLGLNRIFQAGTEIQPTRKVLNFLGAVTVEDDPAHDRTNITIGEGGAGSLTPAAVLAALVGQEIQGLLSPGSAQSATTRAFVEARDAAVLSGANAYTDAQLAAFDLSSKADKARQIISGPGLTGGGDLSADRTLAVVAADGSIIVSADAIAVGVISDAQHGTRAGGALHAVATTSVHGFHSATDKAAHDALVTAMPAKADTSAVNAALALKADKSVQTIAGAGLTGGGDHSADRTLNVVAADGSIAVTADAIAVGVISDAQHGTRGGGTTHAVAVAGGAAGFMSGTHADRVAKLYQRTVLTLTGNYTAVVGDCEKTIVYNGAADGFVAINNDSTVTWPDGATLYVAHQGVGAPVFAPGSGVTLLGFTGNSPAPGNVLKATRIAANTWSAVLLPATVATASKVGLFASADKTKLDGIAANAAANGATAPAVSFANLGNAGVATTSARSDHRHEILADQAPQSIGGTNQIGSYAGLARSDHVHAHGAQTDGTMHAIATTASAGFMSTTHTARLDLIYAQQSQARTVTKRVNINFGRSNAGWVFISQGGIGADVVEIPRSQATSGATLSAPADSNQVRNFAWLVELSNALPDAAAYITGFRASVQCSDPAAGVMPTVKVQIMLSEYDDIGLRSQRAYVLDPSTNVATYSATHYIAWTGSIAINPMRRYVAEIMPDTHSGTGYPVYLKALELTCECYSVQEAFVQAMTPHTWLRADSVTLSGATTTQLKNRALGATDVFNITGTVAAPAADSSLMGQPSLTTNGTQRGTSSRPAADFVFLQGHQHDVFHVLLQTSQGNYATLHSTCDVSTTQIGVRSYLNASTGLAIHELDNGSATLGPTGLAIAVNTPRCVETSCSVSGGTNVGLSENSGEGNGVFGNAFAPSASAPNSTLSLWSVPNGTLGLVGRWAETIIFNRVLTALERQLVREYIQARYGIQASAVSAAGKKILAMAPQSWAKADVVTLASGNVVCIHDKAKHGHTFTNASAPNRAVAPTVDAAFGGKLVITNTASSSYPSAAPASFWQNHNDGTGAEVYFPCLPTNTTGVQVYFATRTSTVGLQVYLSGAPTLNFYSQNGSSQDILGRTRTVTAGVAQMVHLRHGTGASPQVTARVGSDVAGAYSNTPSATAPNGGMCIGGAANGGTPFVGRYPEFLSFNRVLSATERADVAAYYLDEYGLVA